MDWQPITSDELRDKISAACLRMKAPIERLWEAIRITPERWQQHPYGDLGNGFWVVAVIGEMVVWYNDIEDGFNRSTYKEWGTIDQYHCNQDELEESVQQVANMLELGYDSGPFFSAPIPCHGRDV